LKTTTAKESKTYPAYTISSTTSDSNAKSSPTQTSSSCKWKYSLTQIIAIDYNLGVIAFLRKMYSMAYDHLKKISYEKKMMNEAKCPLLLIRTSLLLVVIPLNRIYLPILSISKLP
jgi:hypothetical protein